MPTREKPRNLKDVSHLFLSRGERSLRRSGKVEAVLWLVSVGSGNNRAFMASGFAAAAAAKGIHVTLLEIGEGLPNVGYYFSLDPSEYAAAGVDPSRLVTGGVEPNLRFVSCTEARALDRYYPERNDSGSPHLLLIAFDATIGHGTVEGVGRRWMPDHQSHPDALCAFGGPDSLAGRRTLFESMRGGGMDAFLIDLVSGRSSGDTAAAGGNAGADETLSVPGRLVLSWRRRAAPEDRFFDDVISNVLQVLSHRRRRMENHASG